jgi:hypothetical protein
VGAVIPAEAVEAAVHRSWHLEITTSDVREILEAAAPHMLAGVWDEGERAGVDAMNGKIRTNPYRSQA